MAQQFKIKHRFVNDQVAGLWLAMRRLERTLNSKITQKSRTVTVSAGDNGSSGGCCEYHYTEPSGGTDAMGDQSPGGDNWPPERAHRYIDFWVDTANDAYWAAAYPFFWTDVWYPHIRSDMDDPNGAIFSLGRIGYKFLATTSGDWRPQPHVGEFAKSDAWCWVFGNIDTTTWGAATYEPYISVGVYNEDFPPYPGSGCYYDGGEPGYTGSPWLGPVAPTNIGVSQASEVYPWSPFPRYTQMYFVDLAWKITDCNGENAGSWPIGSCEDHFSENPDALAMWIYNFNRYMGGGINPTEASAALVFLHLEWKPVTTGGP